ncbi:MAG: septum site-determining protein MinC [Telluria sp.]
MSKSKAVEVKISTVVAVSVVLHAADPLVLDAALRDMTGGTPDFFEDDLAVLDVTPVADAHLEWDRLVAVLKKYRLHAVAVRGALAESERQIRARGLVLDDGAAAPARAVDVPAAAPAPAPAAPAPATAPAPAAASAAATLIIDQPVRAGQRIYARGADLVVNAAVNHGAEIIADGSIHVYAPLKGRALAGAAGNAEARIFALAMEPELVSIAGVYRTFDDGFPRELANKPAQIRLAGDRLDLAPLG